MASIPDAGNDYLVNLDGFDGSSVLKILPGNTEEIEGTKNPDYAKIVVALLISIFGLLGNFIAMFLILALREYRKSVTHWYVLQLAIADSIFLLTLPFKISEDLNNQWIYPEWMCKGKETILFLNYYASIFFLMIMTIDRYIAVCHVVSEKLQRMRKHSVAFAITIGTWIFAFLLCIPVMLYSFKTGNEPYCVCSYEFPQYDSEAARCINEGLQTQNASQACVTVTAERSLAELHCRPNLFLFDGLTNLVDSSELDPFSFGSPDDFGTDAANSNASLNLFDSQNYNNSLVQDFVEEYDTDVVNAACNYWNRPSGWIAFIFVNFTLFFLVPLFVMIACYGLIVRRLSETRVKSSSQVNVSFTQSVSSGTVIKRRKASSRSEKDRRRVTIMCATLVSCFVICWLPFHAIHMAKTVGIANVKEEFCQAIQAAGTLLAFLNSALNPYLYSFLGTNFRRRWKLLKKSRGFRPFIDAARWKHSESSASNRQQSSKAHRTRNGSQNMRRHVSINNIQPPQTTNVRLSMMKTTVPQPEDYQLDQNNYGLNEVDTNGTQQE